MLLYSFHCYRFIKASKLTWKLGFLIFSNEFLLKHPILEESSKAI